MTGRLGRLFGSPHLLLGMISAAVAIFALSVLAYRALNLDSLRHQVDHNTRAQLKADERIKLIEDGQP